MCRVYILTLGFTLATKGVFSSQLSSLLSLCFSSSPMNEKLLDEILQDIKNLINVRFWGVGHIIEWYLLSKLPH